MHEFFHQPQAVSWRYRYLRTQLLLHLLFSGSLGLRAACATTQAPVTASLELSRHHYTVLVVPWITETGAEQADNGSDSCVSVRVLESLLNSYKVHSTPQQPPT